MGFSSQENNHLKDFKLTVKRRGGTDRSLQTNINQSGQGLQLVGRVVCNEFIERTMK